MWDPPTADADAITGYNVSYIGMAVFASNSSVTTTTTSVTLIELEEFVTYTIRVQAVSDDASGIFSDPVDTVTQEAGQ